jgi:hypothetical protein
MGDFTTLSKLDSVGLGFENTNDLEVIIGPELAEELRKVDLVEERLPGLKPIYRAGTLEQKTKSAISHLKELEANVADINHYFAWAIHNIETSIKTIATKFYSDQMWADNLRIRKNAFSDVLKKLGKYDPAQVKAELEKLQRILENPYTHKIGATRLMKLGEKNREQQIKEALESLEKSAGAKADSAAYNETSTTVIEGTSYGRLSEELPRAVRRQMEIIREVQNSFDVRAGKPYLCSEIDKLLIDVNKHIEQQNQLLERSHEEVDKAGEPLSHEEIETRISGFQEESKQDIESNLNDNIASFQAKAKKSEEKIALLEPLLDEINTYLTEINAHYKDLEKETKNLRYTSEAEFVKELTELQYKRKLVDLAIIRAVQHNPDNFNDYDASTGTLHTVNGHSIQLQTQMCRKIMHGMMTLMGGYDDVDLIFKNTVEGK